MMEDGFKTYCPHCGAFNPIFVRAIMKLRTFKNEKHCRSYSLAVSVVFGDATSPRIFPCVKCHKPIYTVMFPVYDVRSPEVTDKQFKKIKPVEVKKHARIKVK